MRSSPRSLLNAALVLCIPALMAGKGKCRRDPDPTDTDTDVDIVDTTPPDPEIEVQVVSVSPGQVKPTVHTPLTVYGAGFEDGATVKLGSYRVERVQVADANTLTFLSPALPTGSHDLTVSNPDGRSATLRSAVRAVEQIDDSCRRMAMYFALDEATLSESAKGALRSAMPCLKAQASIRLEGHADARGTTDYNLALGQRRAESVSAFLMSEGIPPHKLPVVSYGEERPADPSENESAWAKNRRVEMVAK